ncbi:MAG: bifunctional phosphoribosyl-AMP cyclohydrolase/phosphoribosyl-ATP diphosphatase HisIE [Synergistaceae bacterium]|jgi:phosphoribosyl-ATP pyrophosphohydrolase/phosphoribosyl-AMP cyclohydrolase|nr:bifunctional phosphoribosyl-AMP cyclohydrolase/phosphoribosyl-ATP diphosphatase HisIE [Synergistaceae bacterium]MDD2350452.1 bifunctional phosphoribosyl-AMP cyclohydrolase/phosphoribosyl-ATP diphosphatase HisIE [Synergistaceae bacterium]MDD3672680.1 bifunctional phosphoribosyl-AMP cyclohydrolase/phosphoribosyl-ATP diphosphatase HisIE [Synergistaceae bacterium]MDD4705152.1 bifunctional phosphoribosyl-AMP cyclohydrolase/phosphoribosyl-ATP diphosphatase HisIE [Synergistaceae bacterium]MDD542163
MSVIDMSLIKFDEKGLVPVVVQDSTTAEVLMTAWANEEALKLTADSGELTLWSRSRKELWKKGETSGNVMKVVELRIDCDGDTLLAIVDPAGPACHTGKRTCFYRSLWGKENSTEATFLGRLWQYLNKRRSESPEESYTARLLAKGPSRVAQKVGEEGVETAIAAATGDRDGFRYEAADLLYHLLVACISTGVSFKEVLDELMSRHKKDED